jgi:hypothetical protein
MADICGVILANFRRDPEIGAEEGRTELGDEFFLRVAFIAKPRAPEIPCEALLMFRPVRDLMRKCGGVALGVAESLKRRHLHVVGAFGVEGARPAVADDSAGRGKEPVGSFDALHRGEGRVFRLRGVMRGQVFALLGLKTLHDDKRLIFTAAAHAQRAADYLHGLQLRQHHEIEERAAA